MAFAAYKSFSRPLARLFNCTRTPQSNIRNISNVFTPRTYCLKTGSRSLTRSFALLCREGANPRKSGAVVEKWTKSCGCCGLHTAGDKELTEFLTEEIALEKKGDRNAGKLPQINGFDVDKSGVSEVKLTKTTNGETVTVRFNVNHSVDDDGALQDEQTPEQEPSPPQMLSKPAFVVEINKGGAKTLHIQCLFPPSDHVGPEMQGEEESYDMIEIQEVTLVDAGKEWGEKDYILSGPIMDGNLYDMLLNMMEERGIDGDFVEQLINFSTVYEHQTYITFLEQLKTFTS